MTKICIFPEIIRLIYDVNNFTEVEKKYIQVGVEPTLPKDPGKGQ